MKTKQLYLILTFLATSLFVFSACENNSAEDDETTPSSSIEEAVVTAVNAHRTAQGLPEMEMNETIRSIARVHSRNMADGSVNFGHSGFEDRVESISTQIDGVTASAENVLLGATSGQEAVETWLSSPGHKENIEGDYNLTGVGVVEDPTGILLYTQIFIKASQ